MFSGIGVSFFVLLITLIRVVTKRFHASKTGNMSKEPSAGDIAPLPTEQLQSANILRVDVSDQAHSLSANHPDFLYQEFEDIPPLQQHDAVRHYIGLIISCEGRFLSASPIADGQISVHVVTPAYHSLFFTLDMGKHPGIGRLRSNASVTVRGRISQMEYGNMKLVDVDLLF
jgi:hypothetical protein